MKRWLSAILSCALLLGMIPAFPLTASAASWADAYLENLVDREIMQGDETGNLRPEDPITRAEFAALVNRIFGFKDSAGKSFGDVPQYAWFASDMAISNYQGYLQGDGKGANPYGNLTREEAAVILCRALHIPEYNQEKFVLKDDRDFSNWSRGYINAAVEKGFVSGYPDGSFQPSKAITRGEAAKMLSELGGEIIARSGETITGLVEGNVTIATSGVDLTNATIEGDLYITEGVGLGYVNLSQVNVKGEMIISGAGASHTGESSIKLDDCDIAKMIVDLDIDKDKTLTIKLDNQAMIDELIVKSSLYLEEISTYYEAIKTIRVQAPPKTELSLNGIFGDVLLLSPEAKLNLYKGKLNSITVHEEGLRAEIFLGKDTYTSAIYFDAAAKVTGLGQIESVLINAKGVTIEQVPDNIYIRPGITAVINGKIMNSEDAEMDALKPAFSHGYPLADKVLPAGFTEYYETNKPGKVYYAVYPAGMPAPSKEQLLAKNTPPPNALKAGNLNTLPDKEISTPISGLKAGEVYEVYSVFFDLRNRNSEIKKNTVETVDNVMPVLLAGYPQVQEAKQTSAKIALAPNKNCTYYWAVLPKKGIAPNVAQIYSQDVPGSLAKGILKGGRLGTVSSLLIEKLNEFELYTLYVVLRDESENMSKTPYKFDFNTTDMTAPKFSPDNGLYPQIGIPTTNSIPIEFATNEACTFYWAAVLTGNAFLSEGTRQEGDIWTDAKSKATVKSGAGAFKAGKQSVSKPDTLVKANVSGLQKEMIYDIYYMMEDKAGNMSHVHMFSAQTKDSVKPTVELYSEQQIGKELNPDTPIYMRFSEIVAGNEDKEGKPQRLSDIFLKGGKDKTLDNYIRLKDSHNKIVTINWNEVTVQNTGAKTVIIFQPAAFTPKLQNDSQYSFELYHDGKYIVQDMSKNQLLAKTRLDFTTTPPLTRFKEIPDSGVYHALFKIEPDAKNTNEETYFDMIWEVDIEGATQDGKVSFELYVGTELANMKPIEGTIAQPKSYTLNHHSMTSLTEMLVPNSYKKYKDLEPYYYGIRLTKVLGTDIPKKSETNPNPQIPIQANVNFKLFGLIGNPNKMRNFKGYSGEKNENFLKQLEKQGTAVSLVSDPSPFELLIQLKDQVPPKRIATEYTSGSTEVLMNIEVDKACEVYYYAKPLEKISNGNPIAHKKITEHALIANAESDVRTGAVAGHFSATRQISGTDWLIEGLKHASATDYTEKTPQKPEYFKGYVIYFYLKGDADTPSEIYDELFKTTEIKTPQLTALTDPPEGSPSEYLEFSASPGMIHLQGDWINISTTGNIFTMVYYVVYPVSDHVQLDDDDTAAIRKPNGSPKAQGNMKLMDSQMSFSVGKTAEGGSRLESTDSYDIYLYAQKYINRGDTQGEIQEDNKFGNPSPVYKLKAVSPLDDVPPKIGIFPDGAMSALHDNQTPPKYNGTFAGNFEILFTDGLYVSGQANNYLKIVNNIRLKGRPTDKEIDIEDVLQYTVSSDPNVNFIKLDRGKISMDEDGAIKRLFFEFHGIRKGEGISFSRPVMDKYGNKTIGEHQHLDVKLDYKWYENEQIVYDEVTNAPQARWVAKLGDQNNEAERVPNKPDKP